MLSIWPFKDVPPYFLLMQIGTLSRHGGDELASGGDELAEVGVMSWLSRGDELAKWG